MISEIKRPPVRIQGRYFVVDPPGTEHLALSPKSIAARRHVNYHFHLIYLLTDSRQRVSDEHIYHARAPELRVHDDHARRFFAYLTDDRRFFSSVYVLQGFEGGVR